MLLIQLDQFRDFTFIGGDGRFNGSRGVVNFDHDTAPVGIANAVYYIRIIPQLNTKLDILANGGIVVLHFRISQRFEIIFLDCPGSGIEAKQYVIDNFVF